MAKVKSSGSSNWKEADEEQAIMEFLDNLLSLKTVDEKGHYERQNIKFRPEIIQKLTVVISEKIRPEVRTIHDLIRGYVEKMLHYDLERGGKNQSEFSATLRHIMSVNKSIKEEYAGLYLLEREIEEAVKNSNSEEEMSELVSKILFGCPAKIKKKAKIFFQNCTIKGRNKKGVAYNSFYSQKDDDEGSGESGENEIPFK